MSWFVALVLACSSGTAPTEPAPIPEPAAEPEPEPLPDPTEERLAATHVLVAYRGAPGAIGVERSREEARALASSLRERATPATLEALAKEHSDDPGGARGGRLGVWRTGLMDLDFERCVSATAVGALGPVCESPFGFHVLRRDPIALFAGEHLWGDSREALEAARAAIADGREPAAVAAELDLSREPIAPVAPGQLLPAVHSALSSVDPGQLGEVFEVGGRFHLVQRLPLD